MESASREDVLLFAGPANPVLARAIAGELGMDVAACDFARFPDGEISARIEPSVRGRHVVLVQPTAPPVNDHLMSLLAFTDACRRSAAASVTAVVPYFGYARSDRRQWLRVPVMGSLVAQLMESAGVDHVVTVDVHAPQLEGFFRIAVDNLTAAPTLADAIRDRIGPNGVVADAIGHELGEHRHGRNVVERNPEAALQLCGVRIDGDDVIDTGVLQDVRDHRGHDRIAPFQPPVGARVTEVRHDRDDAVRAGAAERVGERHELDEVVVDRRRCRLHDEDIAIPDRLVEVHRHLAVGEALDLAVARRDR